MGRIPAYRHNAVATMDANKQQHIHIKRVFIVCHECIQTFNYRGVHAGYMQLSSEQLYVSRSVTVHMTLCLDVYINSCLLHSAEVASI